jgi:hypothetical protein
MPCQILRFTTTTTRKPGTFSVSFFSFIRKKKSIHAYTALQLAILSTMWWIGSICFLLYDQKAKSVSVTRRWDQLSYQVYTTYSILIDNIVCMSVIDSYDIHYRLGQSYQYTNVYWIYAPVHHIYTTTTSGNTHLVVGE